MPNADPSYMVMVVKKYPYSDCNMESHALSEGVICGESLRFRWPRERLAHSSLGSLGIYCLRDLPSSEEDKADTDSPTLCPVCLPILFSEVG